MDCFTEYSNFLGNGNCLICSDITFKLRHFEFILTKLHYLYNESGFKLAQVVFSVHQLNIELI